jgi:hypothetical protein
MWLLYVALEPYVRRRWPERIIAWSRLLAGGYRDPLVGRDLLIGVVCGGGMILCGMLAFAGLGWLGRPAELTLNPGNTFIGAHFAVRLVTQLTAGLFIALISLFLLLLFVVVLRRACPLRLLQLARRAVAVRQEPVGRLRVAERARSRGLPSHVVACDGGAPAGVGAVAEDGDVAVEDERGGGGTAHAISMTCRRADRERDRIGRNQRNDGHAPVFATTEDEARAERQLSERTGGL